MDTKRRVVVTGMGMVSPLGTGVKKSWDALCRGESGIGPITHFDSSQLKCHIAAEVKDFNPLDFMDSKFVSRFDPYFQYALAAAKMAMEDSGFKTDESNQYRTGVIMGTAVGAHNYFRPVYKLVEENKLNRVTPFFVINCAGNMMSATIAIEFGCKGPHHCIMDACAASTNAIGVALRAIQYGEADIMLAGGAEAGINAILISSLDALGAMTSKKNSEPDRASRPFDANRDGFVAGEGSGVIVMESLDNALKRGARIYGEVAGYANNCDAYHYTAPTPSGEMQIECMKLALQDAQVAPEQVDYINAHGTSTALNDVMETKAIKSVFGKHATRLAISSNKSAIGHLLGAAGVVESIFTLLTITNGIIPPTLNQEFPDKECDLDYVPNKARKAQVNTAISNSFGFGGINGTLVFKKFVQA